MLPDLFPLGLAFERVTAAATGADPEWDVHQLRDVEIHMETYREHLAGAAQAVERGDLYNSLVERTDAVLNRLAAWVVAMRISDPGMRAKAFALVNS